MNALLFRLADTEFGVFGHLHLRGPDRKVLATFRTAEDDWLNNAPGLSCIPAGTYNCVRVKSPKFGDTFEVTGVPGRDAILFHDGNTEENTRGCILLGERFGLLKVKDEDSTPPVVMDKWAVLESKVARTRFMALLAEVQGFSLEVRWARPGEWRVG